jgi:hypothetical protein
MERLTFTNAQSEQIEFNKTGTYRWTSITDLGAAEVAIQTTASPYQDGRTPVGEPLFLPRAIQIQFLIVSDSVPAALRELNSILNPKLGNGTITYERDGVTRMLQKVRARVLPSMPGGRSRGLGFQMTSVILEAFDPFYADVAETEAGVATGGNCFEFPLNITEDFVFDFINTAGVIVTNSGDVESPIIIVLDGPKSAPLEIENVTIGEKIVLALEILEGERLTITTEPDNLNVILTNIGTGNDSVAFQYIDVAKTTFWQLARGQNNIKIAAGEAAVEEAVVKYRNKYVGV